MVAKTETIGRDSKVVEIEFHPHVPLSTITGFIDDVNKGLVPALANGDDDQVKAAFAFQGAPQAADSLQPRRDRFVAVRVPSNRSSNQVAAQLKGTNPDIKAAARRPIFVPASNPIDDPLVGSSDSTGANPTQWYVHRCKANLAWKQSLGKRVVVADIDWGFRLSHDDLAARYDAAALYNVLEDSANVSVGDLTHGTGAAGMIGAGANGKGIAGFAPECTLWLVQAGVVSEGVAEAPEDLVNPWASAIDWVVTRPSSSRKVINIEIQTGMKYSAESSVCVQGAVRRAVADEVFVCVPAGNGGSNGDIGEDGQTIPDTGSIVVGATGYDPGANPRALFSNWGQRVRLAAPGESKLDLTCGAASDSHYTSCYGGTSGASAKVAGALALVLSRNEKLTHAQLLQIIRDLDTNLDSVEPLGKFLNCEALSDGADRLRQIDEQSLKEKYKESS